MVNNKFSRLPILSEMVDDDHSVAKEQQKAVRLYFQSDLPADWIGYSSMPGSWSRSDFHFLTMPRIKKKITASFCNPGKYVEFIASSWWTRHCVLTNEFDILFSRRTRHYVLTMNSTVCSHHVKNTVRIKFPRVKNIWEKNLVHARCVCLTVYAHACAPVSVFVCRHTGAEI